MLSLGAIPSRRVGAIIRRLSPLVSRQKSQIVGFLPDGVSFYLHCEGTRFDAVFRCVPRLASVIIHRAPGVLLKQKKSPGLLRTLLSAACSARPERCVPPSPANAVHDGLQGVANASQPRPQPGGFEALLRSRATDATRTWWTQTWWW